MLFIILIVLLVIALVGGGLSYPRYGYVTGSPFLILLIILIVLWAAGVL